MAVEDRALLIVGLHSSGKTTLARALCSSDLYRFYELGDGVREVAQAREITSLVEMASQILAGEDPVLLAKMATRRANDGPKGLPIFVGARTVTERDYLASCYSELIVIGLSTPNIVRKQRWETKHLVSSDVWGEREKWEAHWHTQLLVDNSDLILSGVEGVSQLCKSINELVNKEWGGRSVCES